MAIRKITIAIVIGLLLLSALAYGEPDPHRFDPLMKTNWYGLYMQGMKMGYGEMSLEKVETPVAGWRQATVMTIIMKAAGQETRMINYEERVFKAPDGELYSLRATTSSPTGNIEIRGYIENDSFVVNSNIGGQETISKFASPVDYIDSSLVAEMRILAGKAAVGDSIYNTSFQASPPLLGKVTQIIKFKNVEDYIFNGLPSKAYSIDVDIKEANITMSAKVDSYGNYIELAIGSALTFKLEDEAIAKNSDIVFDMLLDNLVKPDKPIVEPQRLKSLKLQISGIDVSGLLATDMQKVKPSGDYFEVTITTQNIPKNPPTLPITAEPEFLKSEQLIQSDNPQIIELARSIVGGEKNSWEAAKKINAWVYANIEKKFTPDLSNALQTLNSRQGDCGEHTALAVALLRAAGIPARPIVGLMYWQPGEGFGYHAWVEAYFGRWIQMDPTWNEELANPTHVSLTSGNIISQAGVLLKVLGKMKIEVVSAK